MESKISETIKAFFGTLIFLIFGLFVFLIWIPNDIISSPNHTLLFDIGVFRYVGIVPIVVGVVIYFWCSSIFVFIGKSTPYPFDQTKKILITGLYRFVRNPMYIAGILVLIGEVMLFQSKGLFIYCLAMFGVINLYVPFVEEPHLLKKFGGTYKQYRKSVPRWIPRLTPYRENDSESQ